MSLIAWYKLDKLNGSGLVPDCSGNGLDGTPTDVSFVAGKIGQAAEFNGSSSLIDCGTGISLIGLGPYSGFAWIYLNEFASYKGIFSNGTATAAGTRLSFGTYIYSGHNYLRLDVGDGTGYFASLSSADKIAAGAWYHVGFVRAADGYVTFYVNGQAAGGSANARVLAAASLPFEIGRNYHSSTYTLNGLIDDVRIVPAALPAWMVREIHNHGRGTEKYDPWRRTVGGIYTRRAA
jgi:hypothetical protein